MPAVELCSKFVPTVFKPTPRCTSTLAYVLPEVVEPQVVQTDSGACRLKLPAQPVVGARERDVGQAIAGTGIVRGRPLLVRVSRTMYAPCTCLRSSVSNSPCPAAERGNGGCGWLIEQQEEAAVNYIDNIAVTYDDGNRDLARAGSQGELSSLLGICFHEVDGHLAAPHSRQSSNAVHAPVPGDVILSDARGPC